MTNRLLLALTFCISAVCSGCRTEVEGEERLLRLTEFGPPMDLPSGAPLSVTGRIIDADGAFAIASYGRHRYCFVLSDLLGWRLVTIKATLFKALNRRVEVKGDFLGFVRLREKSVSPGDYDPIPCNLRFRARSIASL